MFRRCLSVLEGLDINRVVARVTGQRYDLDEVLTLLKHDNHKVLLTFPSVSRSTNSQLIDRKRKTLQLLAFEVQSTQSSSHTVTHFLMKEGVHVAWGASNEEISVLEKLLEKHIMEQEGLFGPGKVAAGPTTEFMGYQTFEEYQNGGGSRPLGSFVDTETDTFVLEDDDVMMKVPFTFALAQSALIDATTVAMAPVAKAVRQWSRDVSAHGKLDYNIRNLRQHKAQMMLLSTDAIGGKALDKPAFFWYASTGQLRHLETVYMEVQEHLEIERRKWFLQERLQHILTTMEFLRGEHHTELSHRLEWVIVLLIMVEVLFAVNHFVKDNM